MTTDPGQPAEPTLADVMAALTAIAQTQAAHGQILQVHGAALDSQAETLATVLENLDHVETKVDQVAQDVMAVKVDTGFIDRHIADFQAWARTHQGNPGAHRPAA